MGINDITAPAGTSLYFLPISIEGDIETGMVAYVAPGGTAWTKDMVFVEHDTEGSAFVSRDRTFLSRDAAEVVLASMRRHRQPFTKLAA